jgi:hypothetical protein
MNSDRIVGFSTVIPYFHLMLEMMELERFHPAIRYSLKIQFVVCIARFEADAPRACCIESETSKRPRSMEN